jgi:hypothetical protein
LNAESRQRWFAQIIESGLEHEIFGPSQVLSHVTPEVMAHNLPPEIMTQVLQTSLTAGSMTPERVLETLKPALLARHIPLEVLWECVVSAAERAGLSKSEKSG